MGMDELRKKVSNLLEMNLERCRIMHGREDVTSWLDNQKAQEVEN